ncbi:uncharacterized protein LOC143301788 [Babylonia areolata]|uniref:uncharacterized protein LOC143301788 n=1 Tax=Babylonia areolata TaxID=304850 RepID=UPI003FD48718
MSLTITLAAKKHRACFAILGAAMLLSLATIHFVEVLVTQSPVRGDVTSASRPTLWQRLWIPNARTSTVKKVRLVSHTQGLPGQSSPGKSSQSRSYRDEIIWTTKNIHLLMEDSEPLPDMVLHIVWCGTGRFLDYRHYLSIKSAVKIIQPRNIMFHYQLLPMTDPDGYFTWFEQLRSEYPNMTLSQIVEIPEDFFSNSYAQYAFVFDTLRQYGGIFVPEDSLVLKIPARVRNMSFVSGISSCNQKVFFAGMVIARKDQFEVPELEMQQVEKLSTCNTTASPLHPCTVSYKFRHSSSVGSPSCVRLTSPVMPRDLWTSRDRLAAVAKMMAYGQTEVAPRVTVSANEWTPRVAHYLCEENCTVTFTFFLSVLSALHVAGMDHVMIHGPVAPSGEWWERLHEQRSNVVRFIQRNEPRRVSPAQQEANEMQQYITRTEILLQYGGVFHDSHVIWTQPLPEAMLRYEAVVSPGWRRHGSWPGCVNHGVVVASKASTYLQQLLTMYRENANTEKPWLVDSFLSYRLIELDPTLVFLNPRLQVKCLEKMCHPMWEIPNESSAAMENRFGHQFDWRRDTLSVHWDPGTAPELDVEQVRFSSEMITEIAEHVLSSAGEDINFFV